MHSPLLLLVDDAPTRLAAYERALAQRVGVIAPLTCADKVLALLTHLVPDALVLNRDVPGAEDVWRTLSRTPAAGPVAVVTYSAAGHAVPSRLLTAFRRGQHHPHPLPAPLLAITLHRLLGRVEPWDPIRMQGPHSLSGFLANPAMEAVEPFAGSF